MQEDYQLHAIDSIGRLPLSEQVYITLKQAILTGALQPDLKLNEVKIAEQLNVSATPVREAFRKLAKDNLVVIKPWRGVTVKGYSPEEIIALYQCREVMEGLAARLCATLITDEQMEELEYVWHKWRKTTDSATLVRCNNQFHSLIVHFSGNERIIDFLADLSEMINRDMYLSTLDSDRTHHSTEEHEHILDAIRRRDPEAAETAMRHHIANAFVYKKAHADLKNKQK